MTSTHSEAAAQPAAFPRIPERLEDSEITPALLNDLILRYLWLHGAGTLRSLHETLKLQFRAEMFNAFNHANFYAPDGNLTDSTFGVISGSLPPRDIQVALKLYW